MSRDTDWAALYGDHPGDASGGRSRPPIWVMVVVVAAVVTGGWALVTQGFAESDPDTSSTLLPLTPVEASVVTTTTASVVTTATASLAGAAPVLSVYGNPPAAITAVSPQQLAGYVAVTSPDDPPFDQDTVWVFRPGGSLVSRSDNVIGRGDVKYPMLMTAGHVLFDGRLNGWIIDTDLVDRPTIFGTHRLLIPGAEAGLVWFWLGSTQGAYFLRVSPVDVESRTVGERVDITDLFSRPIAGVADGLIVVDLEGEFAFWSPTDGVVPLDLPIEPDVVVAASGDLVVVDDRQVNILNIANGEYVSSFERPDFRRPVTSACLSPDGQHVIIVGGWTGQAVVGNTTTGEVISLSDNLGISVQPEHGIGWTTNDQLVFIGEPEGDAKHIFGFDIATGESFVVAQLDGPEEWWLAASGTMC